MLLYLCKLDAMVAMVVGGSDAEARKGETEGGGEGKVMAGKQVRRHRMDRKEGARRYLGNREGLSKTAKGVAKVFGV